MGICLLHSRGEGETVKSCDKSCSSYRDDACVIKFVTNEIREIYEILLYNRKKIEVLTQLNSYINQLLSAQAGEALLK